MTVRLRPVITCADCGRTAHHHAHGWCSACYHRWRRGTIPPGSRAAGIDDLAVALAVGGERAVALNRPERHAAYRQLQPTGLSAAAIAARIGCTRRTVERYRRADRIEAAR